jgi:hypothetical protein
MTTTIAPGDIRAFAEAVRSHLDDLPADDVDELLDGLEADLADQAAEADDQFALPDAAAYAAELRTAAGLPDRDDSVAPRRSLRERLDALDAAASRWVRSNPAIAAVVAFFVSLRPVWWILRAVVLFFALVPLLDLPGPRRGDLLDHMLALRQPLAWLLLGALLLLSVQWGRGRWAPVRWLRVVRTVITVITAVAAPFVLSAAFLTLTSIVNASIVDSGRDEWWQPGLSVEGERVRNIFAYDAEGNPIERVQLFDQNGQPLTTVGPGGLHQDVDFYYLGGGGPTPVAERENGRQPVWNTFPLRELPTDAGMSSEPDPADATTPAFPFAQVPALPAPSSTSTTAEMTEVTAPAPTQTPAP